MNKTAAFLWALLIFALPAAAQVCELGDRADYRFCGPFVELYADTDGRYSLSDDAVLNAPFAPNTRTSLGFQKTPVWTRLTVKNASDAPQRFILVNPRVALDHLHVRVYDGGGLIASHTLGDENPLALRELRHRYSLFPLNLEANQSVSIVSQVWSKGAVEIGWIAATPSAFLSYTVKESIWWGLFAGVVLALLIYNLSMFFSLKDPVYLAYAATALCAFLFQINIGGIFYEFALIENLRLLSLFPWIFGELNIFFSFLFTILFFNTRKTMPSVHRLLWALAALALLYAANFAYSYFDPALLQKTRAVVVPLTILSVFTLPAVGLYGLYLRIRGSGYFLIGHTVNMMFVLYQQTTNMIGHVFDAYAYYGVTVGILFEVVFLSLALSSRIRALKDENEQNTPKS